MNKTFTLDFPTVAFVAAVHAIGGIGLGMWLSQRVPGRRRRRVAVTLMALGAAMHVPMRQAVLRGRQNNANALSA